MLRYSLLLVGLFMINIVSSQEEITTENIWSDYKFYAQSVPGFLFMSDGEHYSDLKNNKIRKFNIKTGAYIGEIIDGETIFQENGIEGEISDYTFSNDETKVLLSSGTESIYRRSKLEYIYVYDLKSNDLLQVKKGDKIREASFNKANDKVAYVYENDLYYYDIKTRKTTQITTDGLKNNIINGATDWVYEEEFSIVKAYEWSPSGDEIAFIRFDESKVKEFTMTRYDDELYPIYETFKYPKVGEKNSRVSTHIYSLKSKKTNLADIGDLTDIYIPRITWTPKGDLVVYKMNRHQNDLKLYKINTRNGKSEIMLHEKNKYYIDIHDNLTFLKDNDHFIWTSEIDGYNHIYLYKMNGDIAVQLTKGKYEVTDFYGIDTKRNIIYFQSNERGPLEKSIYSVNLEGKNKREITSYSGTNSAQFSRTYDFYVNKNQSINQAPSYIVYNYNNQEIRILEENANIASLQKTYGTTEVEFFQFSTSEDVQLNGYIIKPKDFDPTKEYPLFMTQYSGPGSQSVTNTWNNNNYWWYQQLSQKGYIVACVDPRGTGGRGEEFKKMTYMQLGHYETLDQIEAAKYLGSKKYIDAERIGIYGWSYGGYMSSLAILKGNETFAAAIAVAPVTSWKWYDTVYTERYMRTLEENEKGYNENSPIYFTDRLKGKYLLVHGIADDNVHFQNTAEMAKSLIKNKKQYETYFYPNRNHGIYGDNARVHLFTKLNNFILENI